MSGSSVKLRVAGSDEYVSRSRARWLISAGRARMCGGAVEILEGTAHCGGASRKPEAVSSSRWTAWSRVGIPNPAGIPFFRGVAMNGAAVNRGGGL